VKLLNLNNTSLIKIIIKKENFKRYLEAFASELFKCYKLQTTQTTVGEFTCK